MFSAISSYLFGDDATEVQLECEAVCEMEDTVNDWIFVDHVSNEGKFYLLTCPDISNALC